MLVILKEDVSNLGFKDEVVEVKPGYGRNFLIPRGIAIIASDANLKILAENQKQQAEKLAKEKAAAQALASKIEGTKLLLTARTSNTGSIYGSITGLHIADELEKMGFGVNRKMVQLQSNVKEVGDYIARVRLHKEVMVEVPFTVKSENIKETEAAAQPEAEDTPAAPEHVEEVAPKTPEEA